MKNVLLFLLICIGYPLWGQPAYTLPSFDVREELDIVFGDAQDFQGETVPLVLDLYKPIGDDNCLRPLFLIAHGGSWYAGTRKDGEVIAICRQMAARGYVAASLEYRLGHHKAESYSPYAACPLDECIYVADTSEIYRAIYRGAQDTWKALVYLGQRTSVDSTDLDNFYIGGVSAGGFVALQTALWEPTQNKPLECGALAPVPDPDQDLSSCFLDMKRRERPDLGPIKPAVGPGVKVPIIRGVANFFGGIMDPDQLPVLENKPFYFYHQSNDLIVGCGRASLLRPLFQHCLNPLNLCQPAISLPIAYGSCAIENAITANGWPIPFSNDIEDNGPANGLACLANPPTHSIRNLPLRCQQLADLFALFIELNGNDPDSNCLKITGTFRPGLTSVDKPVCYPNPASRELNIGDLRSGHWTAQLFSLQGAETGTWHLVAGEGSTWTIPVGSVPAGTYIMCLTSGYESHFYRIVLIK